MMAIPEDRDEPVIVSMLTVKDIIEMVGKEPLDMVMENKWVKLVFDYSTVKLKVQA